LRYWKPKLAEKLAKKEHEIAVLSVQFEEVAEGFSALQKKLIVNKAKLFLFNLCSS
jgi:hypothetical protein